MLSQMTTVQLCGSVYQLRYIDANASRLFLSPLSLKTVSCLSRLQQTYSLEGAELNVCLTGSPPLHWAKSSKSSPTYMRVLAQEFVSGGDTEEFCSSPVAQCLAGCPSAQLVSCCFFPQRARFVYMKCLRRRSQLKFLCDQRAYVCVIRKSTKGIIYGG